MRRPLGAGLDPASTRMGIIAILIAEGSGVVDAPAGFLEQDGESVALGFDGERFRPVGLLDEESIWFLS